MDKEKNFIEKAYLIHGDKYDYSKVNYINSVTKVCIICPKHGEFWQTPANHLQGHGCPKCSVENTHIRQNSNTEEFIKKAQEVHNNKYDYSKVEYANNTSKVCIICPEHGEFWQQPNNHLHGQGCPKCGKINMGNKQKMTLDEFITRCNTEHNNFYNYDKVIYNGCYKKITITCPIHGDFQQIPAAHLHGQGCQKCGRIKSNNSKKLTTEEFIEKSRQIHGNKYDYSKVKYVNYDTSVDIICNIHGIFKQTPDSHLQGKGCPICANTQSKEEFNINDLKTLSFEDTQKMYSEFTTILRQHNVSSHENAFDKLVNIFLAKIVDEIQHPNSLEFNWKGIAYDDYYQLQDRLQKLYKMECRNS